MRRFVLELVAAISLTVAAAVSFVTDAQASDLMVTGAFARASATPAAKAGAVYFTIRNNGDAVDKLTAVQTEAAQMATLHENVEENGVVSMRHLEAITIAPSQTFALSPKKTHVMLMGLKAPLKKGERLIVKLTFEKAGEIALDVPVAGVAAEGPE